MKVYPFIPLHGPKRKQTYAYFLGAYMDVCIYCEGPPNTIITTYCVILVLYTYWVMGLEAGGNPGISCRLSQPFGQGFLLELIYDLINIFLHKVGQSNQIE